MLNAQTLSSRFGKGSQHYTINPSCIGRLPKEHLSKFNITKPSVDGVDTAYTCISIVLDLQTRFQYGKRRVKGMPSKALEAETQREEKKKAIFDTVSKQLHILKNSSIPFPPN